MCHGARRTLLLMPQSPPIQSVTTLSTSGGPTTPADPQPPGIRMASPARTDAHGLLIIRAWIEEGSEERLRAEVRITNDVSIGIQRTLTLARAEEVRATVEAWLADVVGVG